MTAVVVGSSALLGSWRRGFTIVNDINNSSLNLGSGSPPIGLSEIVTDQKLPIADLQNDVKDVAALPADQDYVVGLHLIGSNWSESDQITTFDSTAQGTTMRTNLDRTPGG